MAHSYDACKCQNQAHPPIMEGGRDNNISIVGGKVMIIPHLWSNCGHLFPTGKEF